MSLSHHETTDFVTALGRLLSDQKLRNQFARSPNTVAVDLNLSAEDTQRLFQLDADQLNSQADILLAKRWNEIRQRVPKSIDDVGEEAFDVFLYFANHDWPAGHRRHAVDAFRFLQFLQANKIATPNRLEMKRMRSLSK